MPWASGDSLSPINLNAKAGFGQISVLDPTYSADSSGGANSAASIQAALDAAEASGAVVLLSEGTYAVGSTLIINNAKPVIFRGVGERSVISMLASTHALRLQSGGHTVENIKFLGNSSLTDGRGIIVQSSATSSTVKNCVFDSIPSSGIEVQTAARSVTLDHNVITNCGRGSGVAAPFTSALRTSNNEDLIISFNRVENGPNKGIDCGNTPADNDNILILGNTVSVFSNIGIGVGGSVDVKAIGNYVRDCENNGIDFNGHTGSAIQGNTIINCLDGIFFGHNGATQAAITGNILRSNQRGMRILDGATFVTITGNVIDSTGTDEGILVSAQGGDENRPSRIVIQGNTVLDSARQGISCTSTDFVIVANNIVRNANEHGFEGNDADHTSVLGNTFDRVSLGTANSFDGVNLDNISGNFQIKDNSFIGATRGLINAGNSVNGVIEGNVWVTNGTTINISGVDSTSVSRNNHIRGDRTPATGTAAGTAGETDVAAASGTTFFYVCVSDSSWFRAALDPF